MTNKQKILLVEGEADKGFFKKVCKKLSLDTTVKVALPKEFSANAFNTKGGVLSQLELLQTQLEDGHITNIAAIVDADFIEHGSGTLKTLQKASDLLKPFGFNKRDAPILSGFYFDHDDGLPSIGLWIMPDNKKEGMIENWLESCINSSEEKLYKQAKLAVQKIKDPKFKEHSRVKAQISTWLSWQKSPGHGLYSIAYNDLLDENKNEYKNLCSWLKGVFK